MSMQKKQMVKCLSVAVLVLVLAVVSASARAELSLMVSGGHYNPVFGEINRDFDEYWNNHWGHNLGFKSGMSYGLVLAYSMKRFELRVGGYWFESRTGEIYDHSWSGTEGLWEHYHRDNFRLTVMPVVISGIYKFRRFYVGGGFASFCTEIEWKGEYDEYLNGSHVASYTLPYSDRDNPIGPVLLMGLSLGGSSFFCNLEAQYILDTKAELTLDWWPTYDTEVDLSGLQLSLQVGVRFS